MKEEKSKGIFNKIKKITLYLLSEDGINTTEKISNILCLIVSISEAILAIVTAFCGIKSIVFTSKE